MATPWTFYGRTDELSSLSARLRQRRWFFGSIRGRGVGKTALVRQALRVVEEDQPGGAPCLLVQLPDSTPADFAIVFWNAVREAGLEGHLDESIATPGLPGVARAVGSLCSAGVVVMLDEFQTCHAGPLRGFPSLLQAEVDRLQDRDTAGGLILLGSVQTEMEALLNDRRAPLFGRTTFDISLEPWSLATVFEVCREHGAADPSRCLTLWTLFGGVPKYWRHYAEEGTDLHGIPGWTPWAQQVCEGLFLRSDSPLREEGESLLGRELRRNYVALLRVIAERGPCTHAELQESAPELSLGPYLKTLGQELRLVEKQDPVFGERRRRARYAVSDPFLLAWLSVIHPACQAARIEPVPRVAERLTARLRTLEGLAFERMVREATEAASRTGGDFPVSDRVRGYWNRPRRTDVSIEIDLIAWNEEDRVVRFGSCKRNAARHDPRSLETFRKQVDLFLESDSGSRFRRWRREYALYSVRFPSEQRADLEAGDYICQDMADFQSMLGPRERGPHGARPASPKVSGAE